MIKKEAAENYYTKDFDWDQLRQEIESDPSLLYHLLPFSHGENGSKVNDSGNAAESGKDRVESSISSSVEDSEAWNKFHARHSTGKFFKERRYLLKEFPELASCGDCCKVLEVGCGNGSTVLPILRGNETLVVYACDCSNEALDRAKEMISTANLASAINRFHPFLCDFSTRSFPSWLACNSCRTSLLQKLYVNSSDAICFRSGDIHKDPCSMESSCCIGGVDFVTLVFTLSALPLQRMPIAIQECFSVLKPGGILLFRDYGLYDMTMLRFAPEQRVGYREYMRSDGTRSYFFTLESLRDLFSSVGFIVLELDFCCVRSINHRNGKIMRRVWVHGKFQKPNLAQT